MATRNSRDVVDDAKAPDLRTLTLKAAAARTGLPIDRLRRAVNAGEIAVFREPVKPGHHARTTFYLLAASLESWFLARVHGGDGRAATEGPKAHRSVLDPDELLLRGIPESERFS